MVTQPWRRRRRQRGSRPRRRRRGRSSREGRRRRGRCRGQQAEEAAAETEAEPAHGERRRRRRRRRRRGRARGRHRRRRNAERRHGRVARRRVRSGGDRDRTSAGPAGVARSPRRSVACGDANQDRSRSSRTFSHDRRAHGRRRDGLGHAAAIVASAGPVTARSATRDRRAEDNVTCDAVGAAGARELGEDRKPDRQPHPG